MSFRLCLVLGLLGILASQALAARIPEPGNPQQALDQAGHLLNLGRVRPAQLLLHKAVNRWPQDLRLLPAEGAVSSYLGDYSTALVLLQGESLPEGGLLDSQHALANTLRGLGRAGEAAALREQMLASASGDNELNLWLSLAEDLRHAGRLDEAWAAAEAAESMAPAGEDVHAALATIAVDLGDHDLAAFHLWLGRRESARLPRADWVKAAMRLALAEGNPAEALKVMGEARKRILLSPEVAALRAEALRQRGDPEESLRQIDRDYFYAWGEVRFPELLAQMALAQADLGEVESARQILARGLEVSRHPALLRAELLLDGRPARIPGAL